MATIVLDRLTKRYGDVVAVDGFDLEIADGEFVVLVGPSGCGKSTVLNMVAGLEEITAGRLWIDGRPMNDVPPRRRDLSMVFQNYALYPHMSVRENLAFPLKLARAPADEIERRVRETAGLLKLTPFLDRKPSQLSGGQRQRVAMGRAIVRTPKAFLMDEPLSNLDAKLRVDMRREVAGIQRKLGVTTLYVTHDQTEAMTLGDRVVVMRGGVIQQVGDPQGLYNRPANRFVAEFIGSPPMNFLPATLAAGRLRSPLGEAPVPNRVPADVGDGEVVLGIRPEHFEIGEVPAEGSARLRAPVVAVESIGSDLFAQLAVGGSDGGSGESRGTGEWGDLVITARLPPRSGIRAGEIAELWYPVDRLHLFDPTTGRSLGS